MDKVTWGTRVRALGIAVFGACWVIASLAQAQPTFRGASSASTAPAFRSASSGTYAGPVVRGATSAASTSTSLTINRPSGTLADDVMIAAIGVRPSTATIIAPDGWTLVRRVDNAAGQTNSLAVFRKLAGASEPASYVWTLSGSTGAAGGIQSFGQVDTANPVDAEAGQATGSSLSHATPSISTTIPNALIVTTHTFASTSTWTQPSGMTEAFDTNGGGQSIEGNWVLQTPTGASGAKTATAASGATQGNTHILALRPLPPTLAVSKPAGVVENDVLIAAIGFRPASATITPPAGWTLVRRTNNNGTSGGANSLAVYRRVASASEPASYAFDVSGAFGAAGGIQAFFNVDTANPIDIENGQTTAVSLSHATPSVTTTVPNTIIVTAHTYASPTSWTPPTGMTEGFDAMAGGQSTEANHVFQAPAAATGAKTANANGGAGDSDQGNTHILALRAGTPVITISRPAGTTANDVMIAAIGVRPASTSLTAPAGWTLVRRIDNSSGGGSPNSLAIYRKVAGSSEPASYAWQVSGATHTVGGIQSFFNVDPVNPIDVESGQATPLSLSHATPSVTTTVPNAMIVTAHTFSTASTWMPPTGMTEAFDTKFSGQSIEGNYVLQSAAGATGTKTATAADGADTGNAHILALRPASAVASQLYFVHVDHLNTPRLVADATGTTVWRWDQTEPFGSNPADENPSGLGAFDLPLRLPGQYFDKETNLHYNYFRDCYDPALGRYCQSDPIGLDGGINTYAYVSGNPLSKIDPLGLLGWILQDPVEAARKAGQAAGIACASSIPCGAGRQEQNLINLRCSPLLPQIGDGMTRAPVAYDACLETCRTELNKRCRQTSASC